MDDNFVTSTQAVDAITEMLHRPHGHPAEIGPRWTTAYFIGHSYGTIVTTWVMKQRPSLISGVILIDPVCFLLFLPKVIKSFVYSTPNSFIEHVIHYFLSRDIHVASTLTRHFWWWENILWTDDIPPRLKKSMAIFLSGHDFIVPSLKVKNHLMQSGIECAWWDELDHAGFLVDNKAVNDVLQCVENNCCLTLSAAC